MIRKSFLFLGMMISCLFLWTSTPVAAQESLSLSVTPPLFQLNVAPGDAWKSSIKVINSNPYEITVYAQVYDFEPKGEDGQGSFLEKMPREEGFPGTLAHWISVTEDAIVIPPERSADVPITVMVPKGASPGGHFAAMLIGTKPPENSSASAVRTSQVVTSLFFLRVAGDIKEAGSVREFSVSHLFRERPEADFVLRFQNDGNVHLQPQGGITIYNMWGKERGFVPINQKSHFGNVLPESIRRFDFSWQGEASLSDIGRYTAEVAVTYGEEGRQNTSSKVYFWVIPFKATAMTLAILGIGIFFCVWIIRRYVRRVMYLSGYSQTEIRETRVKKVRVKDFSGPLREGVLDLRKLRMHEGDTTFVQSCVRFVRHYYLFFVGIMVVLVLGSIVVAYFKDVLKDQKDYEITVPEGDVQTTISAEEALRQKEDLVPHEEKE